MGKVKINTGYISDNIIPKINDNCVNLETALSYTEFSFPNGEFNWSSIKENIRSCKNESNRYLRWFKDIENKAISAASNCEEDFVNFEIEKIAKFDMYVK